jgi:hypothetical protein
VLRRGAAIGRAQTMEVCHAQDQRFRKPPQLSASRVSGGSPIPRKPRSSVDAASSMATSNSSKSSAATTCARAAPDADFKVCCMNSGAYDGANRNYYFQGVAGRLVPTSLFKQQRAKRLKSPRPALRGERSSGEAQRSRAGEGLSPRARFVETAPHPALSPRRAGRGRRERGSAFSRHDASEFCETIAPSEDQRARGMPGAQCTRSLVCAW